jgi:hypothetical protein
MPREKEKFANTATAVARGAAPTSKIPAPIRFPLLVLLSTTLSSLLYSFAADHVAADLAGISSKLEPWQMGALVGWRM